MKELNIVEITEEIDIVHCRKAVREMALELGFGVTDQTRLITAASELARNIFNYAKKGKMHLSWISRNGKKGMELVFEDSGPGLDPDECLTPGFSTTKSLGMGLPGTRKLMDEFELHSVKGKGTTVTVVKWGRN